MVLGSFVFYVSDCPATRGPPVCVTKWRRSGRVFSDDVVQMSRGAKLLHNSLNKRRISANLAQTGGQGGLFALAKGAWLIHAS